MLSEFINKFLKSIFLSYFFLIRIQVCSEGITINSDMPKDKNVQNTSLHEKNQIKSNLNAILLYGEQKFLDTF